LRRVLENMVKNALEATSGGMEVRLACERSQSSLVFSVHNPSYMPRSVQLQMFHRSFSTKGKGRGIGTYSMKLFGERYLKGKVWFSSTEDKGTTFYFSLPIEYPPVNSK
jgi:signal transduction histidine kinase